MSLYTISRGYGYMRIRYSYKSVGKRDFQRIIHGSSQVQRFDVSVRSLLCKARQGQSEDGTSPLPRGVAWLQSI